MAKPHSDAQGARPKQSPFSEHYDSRHQFTPESCFICQDMAGMESLISAVQEQQVIDDLPF